jgi:hypothetical protein
MLNPFLYLKMQFKQQQKNDFVWICVVGFKRGKKKHRTVRQCHQKFHP